MSTPRRLLLALAATAPLWLAGCATAPAAADPAAAAALAPAGKLRVAVYAGSPTSLVRDAATGETKGVALDLGRAMAGKLGVPFELAEFPNNAAALKAVKEGHADFAFTNATPARKKDMDFSPPLLGLEQGYLVPKGSTLANAAEVDRAGVKVGVTKGSSSERELAGKLHAATLVPVPNLKEARAMLAEGKLDAYATNKGILGEMSQGVPGSRVLDGRYGLEAFAIGVPKGREAGHAWLRAFAEGARADGTVTRAVERAGLHGTSDPQ
jgi:polar amino acid transport system substrate-binding protein